MDVSGETADLVVREAVQVSEEVIKFLGAGAKNLTAFLAAMYSQNNKVVGKTTAKRLARDPAPAEIIQLKKEDIPRFQKLAKQYGVLYFFVHKDDSRLPFTNVVSNSNYAPQLNAIMQELGYPIPQKAREEAPTKKATPRAQPERSSPERENGSKARAGASTPEKPSVRGRLAALQQASQGMERPKVPIKDKARYGDGGNPNDVVLTWKRTSADFYDTLVDDNHVYTYGIDLTKLFSDGKGDFSNVEFIVQNSTDNYYVIAELDAEDGVYYVIGFTGNPDAATRFVPVAHEVTIDGVIEKENKVVIKGLEDDLYIVTETKTDDGYTLLKESIKIQLSQTESMMIC